MGTLGGFASPFGPPPAPSSPLASLGLAKPSRDGSRRAKLAGSPREKCAKCGGRMKLKALVQKPENIARFLKHLGEPTEPAPLAAARAPPYWQARELRHRPQAQTELFDA
jgi:hypothetical protein